MYSLFPIVDFETQFIHTTCMTFQILPHDPEWRTFFENEKATLVSVLSGIPIQVYHIGSTSIPDILAKPIIDILGVVSHVEDLDERASGMRCAGYDVKGPYGIKGRRYFRKVNSTGQRTHHLHIFSKDSDHIEHHLAFRDYLIHHPEQAAEYSKLKARLLSRGVTRKNYVDAKAPFIEERLKVAQSWYRRRK